MRQYKIQFKSFADVQNFVNLATRYPFPIVVGNEDYHVYGTSFMGMFSLDHNKPLTVTLECTDEEAECFCRDAAQYII